MLGEVLALEVSRHLTRGPESLWLSAAPVLTHMREAGAVAPTDLYELGTVLQVDTWAGRAVGAMVTGSLNTR